MEPRVRFAKSSDGVPIAYWVIGDGPPLVHMPWMPWSHIQLEWQNPEMNRWYSALSEVCTLVRYDVRGTGLSGREHIDLGIEVQVRDLEAVLDRLGEARVVLFAQYHSGPAALTFAARHPERLLGMVMWCTYASGADYYAGLRVASIQSLMEDWDLFTETGAHAFVGWNAGSAAHELALLMREAVTPEVARRFFVEMRSADCRGLLPQIKTPTLVLHPRRLPLVDIALARAIAAGIPDARFMALEGDSLAPTRVNLDAVLRAVQEMLQGGPAPQAVAAGQERASRDGLTPRELEVLRMVAQGLSNREIAEALVLSSRTVERHVANIYAKANASNRAQITAYAISNHLV
jgi:DNA-binding CsgD family transcriptional regulator/pimeloyl-ACP methyl ester carboxylesterase